MYISYPRFLRGASNGESLEEVGVSALPDLLARLGVLSKRATGVLALLSLSFSFSWPPSLFLPTGTFAVAPLFLFLVLTCSHCFCISFCFCRFASLYFKTLSSGTHSSQLKM